VGNRGNQGRKRGGNLRGEKKGRGKNKEKKKLRDEERFILL